MSYKSHATALQLSTACSVIGKFILGRPRGHGPDDATNFTITCVCPFPVSFCLHKKNKNCSHQTVSVPRNILKMLLQLGLYNTPPDSIAGYWGRKGGKENGQGLTCEVGGLDPPMFKILI